MSRVRTWTKNNYEILQSGEMVAVKLGSYYKNEPTRARYTFIDMKYLYLLDTFKISFDNTNEKNSKNGETRGYCVARNKDTKIKYKLHRLIYSIEHNIPIGELDEKKDVHHSNGMSYINTVNNLELVEHGNTGNNEDSHRVMESANNRLKKEFNLLPNLLSWDSESKIFRVTKYLYEKPFYINLSNKLKNADEITIKNPPEPNKDLTIFEQQLREYLNEYKKFFTE